MLVRILGPGGRTLNPAATLLGDQSPHLPFTSPPVHPASVVRTGERPGQSTCFRSPSSKGDMRHVFDSELWCAIGQGSQQARRRKRPYKDKVSRRSCVDSNDPGGPAKKVEVLLHPQYIDGSARRSSTAGRYERLLSRLKFRGSAPSGGPTLPFRRRRVRALVQLQTRALPAVVFLGVLFGPRL